MRKIFYLVGLLMIASVVFSGCRRDDVPEPERDNPGIGEPTATTDPGVVIDGVRWATRNVNMSGTFAENPESTGMFFQWNRRMAWSATDETVTGWDSETSQNARGEWERENDPCPAGWRVPTITEASRLLNAGSVRATKNDINGRLFGTAPNQIFLPAGGWRQNNDGMLLDKGSDGHHWFQAVVYNAGGGRIFCRESDNSVQLGGAMGGVGFNIRCVEDVTIPIESITLSHTAVTLSVNGGRARLNVSITPSLATDRRVRWSSSNTAVATIHSTINEVRAVAVGSAIITATTACGKTATATITVEDVNVSASLDGIVINGIRWATRNVDAPGTFASSPKDAGMFYQWNRRIGWSVTDPLVNSVGGTIWDNSNPAGTEWERANDPCPTGWRVPTEEEWESLVKVGNSWMSHDGVQGRLFGATPNLIFLPAGGSRNANSGELQGQTAGSYWSSSFTFTGGSQYFAATSFFFNSQNVSATGIGNISTPRRNGRNVRCVAEN